MANLLGLKGCVCHLTNHYPARVSHWRYHRHSGQQEQSHCKITPSTAECLALLSPPTKHRYLSHWHIYKHPHTPLQMLFGRKGRLLPTSRIID